MSGLTDSDVLNDHPVKGFNSGLRRHHMIRERRSNMSPGERIAKVCTEQILERYIPSL